MRTEERVLAAPAKLQHPLAGEFRRSGLELTDALPETGGRLVIDLRATEDADSTGLEALIAIRRRAIRRGWTVQLRGVGPNLRSLLEVTKIDGLFDIDPVAPH